MEYIPYTYLIGWKELNLYYYGSKYAIDANPKTFWKNYFTSSNKVAYMREKYGEPDVIQIRKTFNDAQSCTAWEYKVLKRVLSKSNSSRHIWINQNIGFGDFYKENNVPEYLSYKRNEYLKNRTDEQIKRDYEARLRGAANEEGRIKQSEFAKQRQNDPEYKRKMKELYSTEERKKIRSDASTKAQSSAEYREKMRDIMKSEETNIKIRENTKKALSSEESKKKMRDAAAKYNSDPENRKKKSELAKAASSNRIATTFMNKLDEDVFKNISFEDLLVLFYEKFKDKHVIDESRLRNKFEEKKKTY